MSNQPNKLSLEKITWYLLLLLLVLVLLYAGRTLFVPMFYGLFIAIILYPLCRWLEKKGIPRSVSIGAGLLIVTILLCALVGLLIMEVNALRADFPMLQTKIRPAWNQLTLWISYTFNLPIDLQEKWLENTAARISDNSGSFLAGTFSATASLLFYLFIVPVFTALFLYNRHDFVLFLDKVIGSAYHDRIHTVLNNSVQTYAHFVKGMILVYLFVGVLNSLGLLALGIRHAILFGFITAIMTIIPYVGIFVSALLPISMAIITKDSIWYPLGVIGVFAFVQYLEANLIFPKVVAAELNISTWATLVAIIAGGIIWGISGMILFVPFVGLLKIITDMVPEWDGLNLLLRRSN